MHIPKIPYKINYETDLSTTWDIMSLTVKESERDMIGTSTSNRFMILPLIWPKDIESIPNEIKESVGSVEKAQV